MKVMNLHVDRWDTRGRAGGRHKVEKIGGLWTIRKFAQIGDSSITLLRYDSCCIYLLKTVIYFDTASMYFILHINRPMTMLSCPVLVRPVITGLYFVYLYLVHAGGRTHGAYTLYNFQQRVNVFDDSPAVTTSINGTRIASSRLDWGPML